MGSVGFVRCVGVSVGLFVVLFYVKRGEGGRRQCVQFGLVSMSLCDIVCVCVCVCMGISVCICVLNINY